MDGLPGEGAPVELSEGASRPVKKKAAKKRAAKKKAAKKKAAKKVAKKSEDELELDLPMEGRMSFSPDDDDESPVVESRAKPSAPAPAREKPAAAAPKQEDVPQPRTDSAPRQDGNQGQKSYGPGGSGGHGNHNNPNNRNKHFNKNKKNKNKNKQQRWQNKKRRSREEEAAIELGELPEFELLEDFEAIRGLAEGISGGGDPLDFDHVYNLPLPELRELVQTLSLETPHAPNRDQLINAVVRQAFEAKAPIMTTGVLDLLEDDEGGILVYQRDSYRIKALSVYVPQTLIEHYGLQRGHIVRAQIHAHRENESCPFVVRIDSVMGRDPETLSEIVPFTERVPYYPTSRILMETDSDSKWDNLSMRVVDCLTPVGFGQRGLIVAPPRTGKTVLMQGMANSIQKNYPDAHLIILLIDERPEEVTDFRRQVRGEVISSTFDESAESHVHAAEMVIEKARRMVEVGEDVVILLDSVTRLARAYNTMMPNSGKILSGGVEANALQKPKRFFGSARNIEDGGSLTIIATALVETGSKMDEVIFEEFKGTGNMELHLDRGLSDKRIFPALSMDRSGTRKEELLYHPDEMQKIYSLRRAMKGLPSTDAMEMLIQRIKKTKTNAEFLMSVAR